MNLPIGKYSVSFTKEEFRTYERSGIMLLIGQTAQTDAELHVGAHTEAITVTADADILPTANTDLGTHMRRLVVQDLPLSIDGGRELESLAYAITPAVEGNSRITYVGGSAAFSKEVIVDGTSSITQFGGWDVGAPSMEAVEEFKVETSGFRAEDARSGGGVFKSTLKSGSNKFHGSGSRALSRQRNFGTEHKNIGIMKNFPIAEKMRLQLRMEFLNIFKRHEFWGPDMYASSSSFGNVYSVGDSPRIGRFGARFE